MKEQACLTEEEHIPWLEPRAIFAAVLAAQSAIAGHEDIHNQNTPFTKDMSHSRKWLTKLKQLPHAVVMLSCGLVVKWEGGNKFNK